MKWMRIERERLEKIIEDYLEEIKEYNSKIAGKGYYLKPVHMVYKKSGGVKRKYVYHGRYWWKIVYLGRYKGKPRIKWEYLGKEKPAGLPDPPRDPLEGLRYYVVEGEGGYVYISPDTYRKYQEVLGSTSFKDPRL